MSSVADNTESDAVNRNTYTPASENDADVDSELAFPNVVVPGPDTCDHVDGHRRRRRRQPIIRRAAN